MDKVFAITIIRLVIGMRLRARSPVRAAELEPRLKRAARVRSVVRRSSRT